MSGAPLIFPKEYVYECPNCHSDIEVPITNGLLPQSAKCLKCSFVIVFPQQIQQDQPDDEDKVADRIQNFSKWLTKAWEKSGKLGKLFILVILLGMASPFILGVIAVLIVWFWIWGFASSVTEKLLVFGVLFSLLTALSLKMGSVSNQMLFGAYLTRRKRGAKN